MCADLVVFRLLMSSNANDCDRQDVEVLWEKVMAKKINGREQLQRDQQESQGNNGQAARRKMQTS